MGHSIIKTLAFIAVFLTTSSISAQIFDSHIQIIGNSEGIIDRQQLNESWIRIEFDSVIVYNQFESKNVARIAYFIEQKNEIEQDDMLQPDEVFVLRTKEGVQVQLGVSNDNEQQIVTFYIPQISTYTMYSVLQTVDEND